MAVFLQNLIHLSFTASFLMLAVFVLRPLLKRAPKWISCLLWALVALRLLCPFSLESAVSLVPRAEAVTQTVTQSAVGQGVAQTTAGIPVSSDALAVRIVFLVWAVGAASMLLYAAISYIRLYLRLRIHMHDSGNVYLCDGIQSPFIFGAFHPRIFLPSGVKEPQKSYVLRHEFAHLARGDQLWKPLGFLILSVYWFHPLVWMSYIFFCKDIELACDERVVRDMSPPEKKAYAETLLLCSISNRRPAACPLSFAEVGVKARVKSVLRYKKPLVSVVAISCIAVVAVAVCFMTETKSTPISVAVEETVSVEVVSVPVTEPVTESVTEPMTEAETEPVTEEEITAEETTKKTTKTTTTQETTTEETAESNKSIVLDPFEPEPYTITQQSGYSGSILPTSSGGYATTAPSQIIWDYGTLRPDENGHLPDVAYGGR
ncbi:MAG: M56 family metallopeptidase [Candidatus Fimenecus sp.]